MPEVSNRVGFFRQYPTVGVYALTVLILVLSFGAFSVVMAAKYAAMQESIGKLRHEIDSERQVQFERNNETWRRWSEMSGKLDRSAETSAKCYEKLDIIIKGMMQSEKP